MRKPFLCAKICLWILTGLLLPAGLSGAPAPAPVPGLYFTNAVVQPDGYARFEVRKPDAQMEVALFYSFNLATWNFWTKLGGGTNRHVVIVPEPITLFPQVFVRAGLPGQESYSIDFQFRNFWNGPLSNGTAAISWPFPMDGWQARFQVGNPTNPPLENALISGPAGSGLVNEWMYFDYAEEGYLGYETDILSIDVLPTGGAWTVDYGVQTLTLELPDPEPAVRRVALVPHLVVGNGLLHELSWTYRNPDTGAILPAAPPWLERIYFAVFQGDYNLFGGDDSIIYESPTIPRSATNFVLNPAVEWTNGMLNFEYEDSLRHSYKFQYSFGNLYEVYGTDDFPVDEEGWWDKGYNPAAFGCTRLGSSTSTATFNGAYHYYIVRVPKHNSVMADTVRGSDGEYYGIYAEISAQFSGNVGGEPDGVSSWVGPGGRGFYSGGFFVIDAAGAGLTGLTVILGP